MDIFKFNPNDILVFVLIMVRTGAIFSSAPIFGHQTLPAQVKAGLTLIVAFLLFPVVSQSSVAGLRLDFLSVCLAISKEMVIGLLLGVVSSFAFTGIQFGGTIIGREMGLDISENFDPVLEHSSTVPEQIQLMFASVVFLAINGHHWLLQAFMGSFSLIPAGSSPANLFMAEKVLSMVSQIFVIGLKVSAPIFVTLMFTTVLLGIIERLIPQTNVFAVGFALKIGVGLIMLYASTEFFVFIFRKVFALMETDVTLLLHSLR